MRLFRLGPAFRDEDPHGRILISATTAKTFDPLTMPVLISMVLIIIGTAIEGSAAPSS